jgi:hypothetical protein
MLSQIPNVLRKSKNCVIKVLVGSGSFGDDDDGGGGGGVVLFSVKF